MPDRKEGPAPSTPQNAFKNNTKGVSAKGPHKMIANQVACRPSGTLLESIGGAARPERGGGRGRAVSQRSLSSVPSCRIHKGSQERVIQFKIVGGEAIEGRGGPPTDQILNQRGRQVRRVEHRSL